jgi:sugar O-acyltransferase (sialic acid O-acetyltransferase NeuD family)
MVAFLGFGELANQFINFLEIPSNEVTIYDDTLAGTAKNTLKFSEYKNHIGKHQWLIALGYKHLSKKLQLVDEIQQNGGKLITFIHLTSYVSKSANVKPGVFIYPMCNIDKGVHIGEGTLINNSVLVSHNSLIGKANYISPGVVISGNVIIGDACFIGSGTVISNGVKIGSNVIIGAGSVITKDIPSGSFVIGNPMVFKNNIDLS